MLFTLSKPPCSFLACFLFSFPLRLPHSMSGHVPHAFLRFPSFSGAPAMFHLCLNMSSISVTPVNLPGSRLLVRTLIPLPSQTSQWEQQSKTSCDLLSRKLTIHSLLKEVLVECVLLKFQKELCLALMWWDLGPLWDFYFPKFMLSRVWSRES